MKKIFLIIFLFTGCSKNLTENTSNLSDMNFLEDLSFEEFKMKLEKYSNNAPFPNIDN